MICSKALTIGGAIFCGCHLLGVIPHEWEKGVRFAALILPCIVVGGLLARFAGFIRGAFFVGLALIFIYAVCMWVWDII